MTRRALAIVWITLAPLLGAPAHAQSIQKCRIDGHLVLQSAPCPLDASTVAAPPPPAAPAETPVKPKKRTLAEVLRERDAAAGARPAVRAPQGDGANVLRSRMGAA